MIFFWKNNLFFDGKWIFMENKNIEEKSIFLKLPSYTHKHHHPLIKKAPEKIKFNKHNKISLKMKQAKTSQQQQTQTKLFFAPFRRFYFFVVFFCLFILFFVYYIWPRQLAWSCPTKKKYKKYSKKKYCKRKS